MAPPRIALLVHDGPHHAEHARALDLTALQPPGTTRILVRAGSRRRAAAVWWRELTEWQPDVVYVVNTASPGVEVASAFRARHGVPYVLDTGDLVFEMARRSGASAMRLAALWSGERLAHATAHTIVVRSTTYAEHLESMGRTSVAVIPDFAPDPDPGAPAAAAKLRAELGLEGALVVGVLGTLGFSPKLGICYGWDLVGALAQLDDDRVRGLVIGDGDGRAWLEDAAERAGVRDRIVFVGNVPRCEVLSWVTVLDVGLSTQTDNLPGRVRTTGKLPIYMTAGCFVLASRVGEAVRILDDDMLVDYEGERDDRYPDRLAARIRRLLDDPDALERRRTLPQRARERFGRDYLIERFATVTAAAADSRRHR